MRVVSDDNHIKVFVLFFSQSSSFFSLNIPTVQMFQYCRWAGQSPMGWHLGPLSSGTTIANWYVGSQQQQNTTWLLSDNLHIDPYF